MRIIELFAGIGACSKALENIGISTEIVDAVEIDKYAIKSFNAIHNTNFDVQDIVEWNKEIKDIDLIMHGSPCQDFSVAGKQAGGDKGSGTRSSLMYESIRIISKISPKYVIWENVKNVLSKKHKHNFEAYLEKMEELGYKNYYQILNAKDYGIPQNRERIFTVSIRNDIDKNFEFPIKEKLELRLKDVLEDKVDEKYYLSNKIIASFYKNEQMQKKKGNGFRFGVNDGNSIANSITTKIGGRMTDTYIKTTRCIQIGELDIKGHEQIRRFYSTEGLSPTLTNMQGGNRQPKILEMPYIVASRGRNPDNPNSRKQGEHLEQRLEANKRGITNCISTVQKDNYVVEKNIRIRKLTPKECWRLMGFNDYDFEKVERINSNTQLYKQAGNSIVVKVLEKILIKLLEEIG